MTRSIDERSCNELEKPGEFRGGGELWDRMSQGRREMLEDTLVFQGLRELPFLRRWGVYRVRTVGPADRRLSGWVHGLSSPMFETSTLALD
jgi:hypothetical protein